MSDVIDFAKKLLASYELEGLESKIQDLQADLNSLDRSKNLSKVSADLAYYTRLQADLKQLETLITQYSETLEMLDDPEMKDLAESELPEIEKNIDKLSHEIEQYEIERKLADPDDDSPVILEIRAGAGGDEASLFASDLFRMYEKYAQSKGWKVSVLDYSLSDANGYKEIVAKIEGKNVYKTLKYESGVHRVQRIPVTESSGRIHTSTASVAILPEPQNIEIEIKPSDIKVDVMRATGAGGQCVNTTDSAVRITHLETGIVVSCQETKHQLQNREKAMQMLRTKLYQLKKEEEQKKRSSMRASQIGKSMRAEKIRTYNYPQNRITDHRIKHSWYNLEEVINGDLEELLTFTRQEIQKMQLAELVKQEQSQAESK